MELKPHKPGMVVHTYHPKPSWYIEAGESGVQSQPQLLETLSQKKTLMQNESLILIPAALCTFTADLFLNIKHAYFRSCGLIFSKAYG